MNAKIQTMGPAELLTFLTLVVALSAYVATVRFFLIERLGKLDKELTNLDAESQRRPGIQQEKDTIKRDLAILLIPDIPMTLSALLLGLYIFGLFAYQTPSWTLWLSVWLFTAAGLALVGLHCSSWVATVRKRFKS